MPDGFGIQRADSSKQPHYETFPGTKPPKTPGAPPNEPTSRPDSSNSHPSHAVSRSPLPVRQLVVLAIIALCEQTALNSISPYLPDMASHFPEVTQEAVGLYVGIIASAFALAQFATNFFWGWLSDRIGRKPVVLMGTLFTAAAFVAFGFCRTLWQAIVVQALMGLLNGNQGVVSTCLGEITDRSNQSRAFAYLPVVYGIGGITGPIVGGLLIKDSDTDTPQLEGYPYLGPNLFSAFILIVDLVITMFFLEESLEEAQDLPPLPERVGQLFSHVWQFMSSAKPSYVRPGTPNPGETDGADDEDGIDDDDSESQTEAQNGLSMGVVANESQLNAKDVLNRDTMLILITFLIFQLANVAYNSLYPIFAQAAPPTGRNLRPQEIGVSLAFAGLVTIVFQVGIYSKLRDKIGNKVTYRVSLAAFVVAFLLMPFVGYKSKEQSDHVAISYGKTWLWVELAVVLIIKTVASVGGLTSALLLITNSAPDHSVLGALNGLAQTLSAAGRAVGPFVSGGLFSLATRLKPKGEALAFGVFGGVAFVGFLLSFGIQGGRLESPSTYDEAEESDDDEDDEDADDNDDDDEGDSDARPTGAGSEETPLLNDRK